MWSLIQKTAMFLAQVISLAFIVTDVELRKGMLRWSLPRLNIPQKRLFVSFQRTPRFCFSCSFGEFSLFGWNTSVGGWLKPQYWFLNSELQNLTTFCNTTKTLWMRPLMIFFKELQIVVSKLFCPLKFSCYRM